MAEGDTEPIFIPVILQKLIEMKKIDIDLNILAVMSTGDAQTANVLIRNFLSSYLPPKIAIMVDGDGGGIERLKKLAPLVKKHEIQTKSLTNNTTIEDHLPSVDDLYVRAVAKYTKQLLEDRGIEKIEDEFVEKFKHNFKEKYAEGKVTTDVATWAKQAAMEIGELDSPPSKIGIAREYAHLLEDADPKSISTSSWKRAIDMARWIQDSLNVPGIFDVSEDILGS